MPQLRGEEMGGRYGESNTDTWIMKCKTDSQWEFDVWLREFKPGLGNNLQGWGGERGEGGGRDVQVGGDMETYGCFMVMFDRNQCYTVKQLSFN